MPKLQPLVAQMYGNGYSSLLMVARLTDHKIDAQHDLHAMGAQMTVIHGCPDVWRWLPKFVLIVVQLYGNGCLDGGNGCQEDWLVAQMN